jgi:23S rRNA pseudouridine2605 synthase
VIQKRSRKEPEKADSDQYMNREGRVLRGRFGIQNLHDQIISPSIKPSGKNNKNQETIRLNRYIANAGLCSRREADTFIATGCVSVNGKIVSEMGYQVKPGDSVSFNGKIISSEKKVYVLLNKPKGFVTTLEDPHADKTVIDLVKDACSERIYPVGRLDKNTTGLLLLTNDGDLTKRLTHPKYNRKKIYHVFLDNKVTREHLQQIVDGLELEDGFVAADSVSYVSDDDKKQVGIEIHSGKNKIVRRIFEHLGYKVMKLDRVYFCGLTKKNLPRGKWRFLSQDEVNLLKMSSK